MNTAELHKRIVKHILNETIQKEIEWTQDKDAYTAEYKGFTVKLDSAFLTHTPMLFVNDVQIKYTKYVELLYKIVARKDPDLNVPLDFCSAVDIALEDILE